MKARAVAAVLFSRQRAVTVGEVFEVPDDRPALIREVRLATRKGSVEIVEKPKEVRYAEARRHVEGR